MSLVTSEPQNVTFFSRFEHIWISLRRYQVRQGLGWSFLAAALGVAALGAADYRLELPWNVRAAGLLAVAAATMAVLWGRVIAPLRWWTRRRTAAEIESRFPQLGQRIRTVVQYAGLSVEQIQSEGVTPSLVTALEGETEIQAQPLPLDRVVPWRRVWAVSVLAAVPALVLLVAAISDPDWRIALQRAFLSNRPYTTLSVDPGNLTIEQGDSVPIGIGLQGRFNREVVLYTRPKGQPDATWKVRVLELDDTDPPSRRGAKLEKVEHPMEYRVTAGPAASPTYQISVRYPLALKSFEVAIKPPAYTNVEPSMVKGGDLRVIEGTDATFRIAFDSPPAEASLVLTDLAVRSKKDTPAPAPRVLPLASDGTVYTAGLNLTKGLEFRIDARTADGRALPEKRYKIEVLEDRAPRVSFEQPEEALEVHPIAEIVNRIRVGDDFGLIRAGIVFQFNNGDEQTLIVKDFTSEPAKSRTTGAIQETLLLEKLAASPTDSLTYYAFAEDNYPAGARRTETDLRYLDIRPFKREYKLMESAGDGPEGEDELATLAELIARQRFNLNRANRLAKHKPTDKTFVEDPLKIAGFEETLAKQTRELAEGVEGIVGQRVEPFHEAEESMLAAVSALDHGQNQRAPAHMGDALRHLIEARDTLRILILNGDPAAAKALRSFDRMQAQKIRKPKKDSEDAEAIAEELEELAQEEEFVYATLAGLMVEQEQDGKAMKGDEGKSDEPETPKKEKPAEKKEDAQKGTKGPKGQQGAKGAGTQGKGKGQAGEAGEPDDADKPGEPAKDKRRDAVQRQEQIADKARELQEKLKKLEAASDLAKARMDRAAGATEKVSGALSRGNTKEATETAKAGAAMLHELARQVKGEIARDVAQELAMARDLADELAAREAELGQMPGEKSGSGTDNPGSDDRPGQAGKDEKGKGEKGEKGEGEKGEKGEGEKGEKGEGEKGEKGEGEKGEKGEGEKGEKGEGEKGEGEKGSSGKNGQGAGGQGAGTRGGWGDLTDAERLERLEEAARTLEHWLKDASLRAEGDAAERIRELLEERAATQVVERMARIGELYVGGQERSARREATELSKVLELLARQLEILHRGIVAPELATLVDFDKRAAELSEKLKTIRTDAEIAEWHRQGDALIHDLEKAGLAAEGTVLAGAFDAVGWDWAYTDDRFRVAPGKITIGLSTLTRLFQAKIQNMILKDIASAHDEATPPEFKELVERYYEVLSKEGGKK